MGLKQRVIFASKQNPVFQYDRQLVPGLFLHSLYQAMNEKCSYIRRHLKPYFSKPSVIDHFILDVITRSLSEDTERRSRLGQTQKQKVVNVHTAQQDGDRQNTVQIQQKSKLIGQPFLS